jgi:hypothetical protein
VAIGGFYADLQRGGPRLDGEHNYICQGDMSQDHNNHHRFVRAACMGLLRGRKELWQPQPHMSASRCNTWKELDDIINGVMVT